MVALIVSCMINGMPGTGYKAGEFERTFDAFKHRLAQRVRTTLDPNSPSSILMAIYGQIRYGMPEPKRGIRNGMQVQRYSDKHRDIQIYLYVKPEEVDHLSARAQLDLIQNRFEMLVETAAEKVPPSARGKVEQVLRSLRS